MPFDAPKAGNLVNFQQYSQYMSVSGVQLKYSLNLVNGQLELCEKGGQYILKPIPPSRHLTEPDAVPENEHLTMQIGEQILGINTAANALIHFKDGVPAYITRRFDVKPDGIKYLQEDFAQLTNRTHYTHGETYKYDGSYEEIGMLIKRFVAAAIPSLERLFQLVVFNYVFSNGDAHLKNFSLSRTDAGEYQLTPAYDLMSTVIHTPQEADTALDLYEGDTDSGFYSAFGYYGRPDFMELAKRLGIVAKRAERIIDQFSSKHALIKTFVENSYLSPAVKATYLLNVENKIKRFLL